MRGRVCGEGTQSGYYDNGRLTKNYKGVHQFGTKAHTWRWPRIWEGQKHTPSQCSLDSSLLSFVSGFPPAPTLLEVMGCTAFQNHSLLSALPDPRWPLPFCPHMYSRDPNLLLSFLVSFHLYGRWSLWHLPQGCGWSDLPNALCMLYMQNPHMSTCQELPSRQHMGSQIAYGPDSTRRIGQYYVLYVQTNT